MISCYLASRPLTYQVEVLSELILKRIVLYMTRPPGGASNTASHVKRLHTWNAVLQNGLIASFQIDGLMEHGGSPRHDPLRILSVSLVHPSAPVFAINLIEVPIRCIPWSLLLLLPGPSTAFVSLRMHRTGHGSCVAHIQ